MLVCTLCVCLLSVIPISAAEETTESTKGTAESIVTERTQDTDKKADSKEAGESEEDTEEEKETVTLTFGMKGDDVLALQKTLEALWYPGFIADGDFGENTQRAVQIFQFYNGLPVTGEADEKTQDVLYSDEAVRYEALGTNSTGDPVQYVQEYLCDAGFLEDEPDGSFGPGTETAVRVFQTAAGVTSPDGTVGKETILKIIEGSITFEPLKLNDTGVLVTALKGKLKEQGFLQKEEPAPSEDDKKEETDKQDEDTIEETSAAEDEEEVETTKADDKKETISTPGAEKTEPVDIYDTEMELAVKEFQMYAGLEITGIADVETCNAILRKSATFTRLDRGAKGTAVEGLQIALKELGYLREEPDGSYGNETKKAVRDFQVVNCLSRDGSFGKKTADVLFGDPLPYDQEVLDNAGNDAEAFAKEILDEVGWDLYAAFEWSANLPYKSQNTDRTTTDSAIYSFVNRSADCLGYASTFYWMAKALGYDARAIGGYVPYRDTDEFGNHAWVEIDMDGVTYVCDPDFENQEHKNGYMFRYGQSGTWQYEYGAIISD